MPHYYFHRPPHRTVHADSSPSARSSPAPIRLTADPSHVWNDLRSFDSLQGEKPCLMYIGLPIPMRCKCKAEARCQENLLLRPRLHRRNSHRVVAAKPHGPRNRPHQHARPQLARLRICRTTHCNRTASGTILTRSTTIISNLYPAWYWRPFERWGVSSRTRLHFSDLARRPQR